MAERIKTLEELQNYLDISEHEIRCKKKCEIFIDKTEYKENEIMETSDYYILPGILDIHFPDDDKYVTLPFNYDIFVYKSDNYIDEKDYIQLIYEPGEVIVNQKYKDTSFSYNTALRVFQGQIKFARRPEQLVLLMAEILNYSVDLIHLEVLVSQLFRCKEDPSKPCRLCNGDYENKCELVNISQIPYMISWLLGFGFERIDKAIKNALVNKVPIKDTALEKVILDY